MTSESVDRGLPMGVEWGPTDLGAVLCDGGGTVLAEVTRAGYWATYDDRGTATGSGQCADGAAAQREAEAALWRCDGFGVGEVRGVRLTGDQYEAISLCAPTTLPGLSGLWSIRELRLSDRIEVDAVRAPARGSRCPACGALLPATGIGCESCGWMGEPLPGDDERAPAEPAPRACSGCGAPVPPGDRHGCDECGSYGVVPTPDERRRIAHRMIARGSAMLLDEPAPREPSAPAATRCSACKQVLACGCDARQEPTPSAPNLHDQIRARAFIAPTNCTCGANVSRWLVRDRVSRCNGCGAVTDHRAGPSAPAAGEELARLLPGLAEDIERVRSMLGREVSMARRMRLARACELLLAERERLTGERDAWTAVCGLATPAELAASLDAAHGREGALCARVDELEALLSAPPAGSVAALLARVERYRDIARDKSAKYDGESLMAYRYEGKRDAYDDAARLIRSTLAAPSPLDRAVAEVVAFPPYAGTLADVFDRIGEALDLVGDESTPEGTRRALAKVARVALAGMLACDASSAKGAGK